MNKIISISMMAFIFIFASAVLAADSHPESWYIEKFCNSVGGQKEVILKDGTRADCMDSEYVYEVGFVNTWDNVPQALHYSKLTGKKPVYVIIINDLNELKYLERLMNYMSGIVVNLKYILITSKTYE